jgi:hypothetical protein
MTMIMIMIMMMMITIMIMIIKNNNHVLPCDHRGAAYHSDESRASYSQQIDELRVANEHLKLECMELECADRDVDADLKRMYESEEGKRCVIFFCFKSLFYDADHSMVTKCGPFSQHLVPPVLLSYTTVTSRIFQHYVITCSLL